MNILKSIAFLFFLIGININFCQAQTTSKRVEANRNQLSSKDKKKQLKALRKEEKKLNKAKSKRISGNSTSAAILKEAKKHLGTKYKYGGTNSKGFDCSGLVCHAYEKGADISLPRRSRDQFKEGKKIKLKEALPGDLIFFSKNGKINHVGLVCSSKGAPLQFIHATSSSGVITTKLEDSTYWKKRFVAVRRIVKN